MCIRDSGRLALKKAVSLIDGPKEFAPAGYVLGWAEKKVSGWIESIMENWQELPLQVGFQVNEQITAGDQVLAREGRILNQVVRGKDAQLPDFRDDFVVGATRAE